jgi:hypothetical protein
VGRPRDDGDRYPSGKLKPRRKGNKPDLEPISGVLWQRMRQYGRTLGLDPRLTTEIGRLNMFGELTVAQTAAAFRIAEIYGRFEGYKRMGRTTRSPSYNANYGEAGIAEELLEPEQLAMLESRHREATEAFEKLVGLAEYREHDKKFGLIVRPAIPGQIPAHLRSAIEQLCVEDKPINPTALDDIRALLQALAVSWKITSAPAAGPGGARSNAIRGPALHFNKHEETAPDGTAKPAAEAKRPNLDRIFWIQVARVIAPHLDEKQLGMAWDIQQALKQREIFRLAKARKRGTNVVPFGV